MLWVLLKKRHHLQKKKRSDNGVLISLLARGPRYLTAPFEIFNVLGLNI